MLVKKHVLFEEPCHSSCKIFILLQVYTKKWMENALNIAMITLGYKVVAIVPIPNEQLVERITEIREMFITVMNFEITF